MPSCWGPSIEAKRVSAVSPTRRFCLQPPMSTDRQASLKLTFLIIGGGLSGLACAYVLRNAGHDVVIFEQNSGRVKSGFAAFFKTEGSIRAPPNMTRLLSRWPGMAQLFQTHGTRCSGISFRSGETSKPVSCIKFHEEIMSDLEADFFNIQHAKAVDISKLPDGTVSVVLEDGSGMRGDIVVGADGRNSFVRSFVIEEDTEPAHIVTGANIAISTKLLNEDPELHSLCEGNQVGVFAARSLERGGLTVQFSSLFGWGTTQASPESSIDTLNLGLCAPLELDGSLDGDWYERYPPSILRFDLSGYDERLQKLIQLGHSCHPTVHKVFEQTDMVGVDSTVVLVGDAAHPVLIHGSHNSSMGIEDAVTLGSLFSHLASRKQIPIFLETYEELRQARTSATQASEYQSLVQISLPRGEQQEARDEALRCTLSQEFDDFDNCSGSDLLVQAWEEYLVLFSYDARDEVDNWWSKWKFTMGK
ncbi:hypothetical protein B0H15DRAFT_974423 [Mycena belliarum]|uniref:FAD-binding domain-containing protein n=1 Tax=Mycena belliarum TaxID=1033014 RepID=A0AAD6TM66_9AGAR|nr:hypothetical protein B0H15DRAFT_974423 [Mycena belliae]